jgi:outer membrane protein assembly factor BamB
VVVTAVRPRYCGLAALVAVAAALVASVALDAQRRPRLPPPKPATLLLPAEPGWTVTLPEAPATAGVAADGVVAVPLSTELRAYDWETGEERWTWPFATTLVPAYAGSVVVAATATMIEAVDARRGTPAWRHPLPSPPTVLLGTATTVYVLDAMGVTARDAATGKEVWSGSTDGIPGSLAVGPRGVAVTQNDSRVMLFAAADGRRVWTRQLTGTLRPLAWAGQTLVVPSTGRTVWALDPGNGSTKWEWNLPATAVGVAGDADRVYITALDNVLRAVNRGNGHQRWQETLATRPLLAPVVFDGAVLIAGLSPPISLFNSQTGIAIGTHISATGLVGLPLVDRPVRPGAVGIVMVMRNGQVIGLRSLALQFREHPVTPLLALPGRAMPRERLPDIP